MRKYGHEDPVVNQRGIPANGATVTVYLTGTSTLATLYSDDALTPMANPLTTSSIGEYFFFVEDGIYDITYSGGTPSITTETTTGVEIFDWKTKPFYAANMFSGADAFAKIQAAHDAMPSTGGHIVAGFEGTQTVTTVLNITKPCTISGLGKRATKFSFTPTSGNAITINIATSAGLADTVVLSDFYLLGPGSGTGNGIVHKGGSFSTIQNVLVDDFGNDGIQVDSSAGGNANFPHLIQVESRRNGRYGLYITPAATTPGNANVVTVIGGSYSTNASDGIRVESAWNLFLGLNADDNTGYGIHYISGATDNYGVVYLEQNTAGDLNFATGALRNTIHSLASSATVTVGNTSNGNAYHVSDGTGYGWRDFPLKSVFSNGDLTFYNRSDSNFTIDLQPGTAAGAARQVNLRWLDKSGTAEWRASNTSSNVFELVDAVNNASRLALTQAGASYLDSDGATSVQLNVLSGSGTAGTQFGDGAGNAVGSVNSAGLGTFHGGALLGNGATTTLTFNDNAGTDPSIAADGSGKLTIVSGGTDQNIVLDPSGTGVVQTASNLNVNGTFIYRGAQTTRDLVRAEVGTGGAIGSVYLSTAGKMYLKVANADAQADWERVTTSAAD